MSKTFSVSGQHYLFDVQTFAHTVLAAGGDEYSYALRDAVGGIDTPCVEVHISNVDAREAFRHISVIAPACVAQVKGRGFKGYCDAIDILLEGPRERLGEGFEERYPTGEVIAAPLK